MTPTDLQVAGWATLERLGLQSQDLLAEKRRERDDQIALFAAVFGSDAGRKVLDMLKHQTVGRPMIPEAVAGQSPVTFDQIAPYATFRAGQNSVVEMIVRSLAEAEKGPAKPRGK